MDFESMLHEDLGNHYQRILKKYKNVPPEKALEIAAILTAAQTQSTYIHSLQSEIINLRKTLAQKPDS